MRFGSYSPILALISVSSSATVASALTSKTLTSSRAIAAASPDVMNCTESSTATKAARSTATAPAGNERRRLRSATRSGNSEELAFVRLHSSSDISDRRNWSGTSCRVPVLGTYSSAGPTTPTSPGTGQRLKKRRLRTRTIEPATRTALYCSKKSPERRSRPPPQATENVQSSAASAATSTVSKHRIRFRNFDEMLQQYHDMPVLVCWNAKWCGPCKLMKKELKIVRDVLKDDVFVANVDTEKFPSLGARYKVKGLPSLLLFKDGEPVHRIDGLESANEIIRQLRDHL